MCKNLIIQIYGVKKNIVNLIGLFSNLIFFFSLFSGKLFLNLKNTFLALLEYYYLSFNIFN